MGKITPGFVTDRDTIYVGRKDAFHIPSVLVTTNHDLNPGQDVRFTDDDCDAVEPCERNKRQAIVDPFLTKDQIEKSAFWVFIDPDLVSNLTHEFEIKGIGEPEDFAEFLEFKGHSKEYNECHNCN
jgi:hypothetical protein